MRQRSFWSETRRFLAVAPLLAFQMADPDKRARCTGGWSGLCLSWVRLAGTGRGPWGWGVGGVLMTWLLLRPTHPLPSDRRWLAVMQPGPLGRTKASVCCERVEPGERKLSNGSAAGGFLLFQTCVSSVSRFCKTVISPVRLQAAAAVCRLIINIHTLPSDRTCTEWADKGYWRDWLYFDCCNLLDVSMNSKSVVLM